MEDVIANQPIVIDNGSGMIKAGFAGDAQPRTKFYNYSGRPKYTRCMAGALEGDVFIGPRCSELRGLMALEYPMEHGIITDWNEMERIWSYIYSVEELQANPAQHPVLLTEAPLNPAKNRLKAAEIFFETFNVPAFHCQIQAVLSLYSCGRTTGVVLDSGDGVTHIVPVFNGFAIDHGIQRIDVAGRDVTKYLRTLLLKEGYNFHRSSELEIVREIKEKCCFLSTQSIKESSEADKTTFKMPDGRDIELGACRNRAPEVLFRPDLIGLEYKGIPECINNSILACDLDLRKTLYSNIVLSGGSTMFQGFGDRLLSEMKQRLPKDAKVRIVAPQERIYGTWIGGSILASLDTFRKIWVTKKEYEDDPKVIFRKTF
uniref:Actin-related protein n=1 Tax=Panagrellus redivivus TaxID=6233 RepID=A0A7E4URU8_PANRE